MGLNIFKMAAVLLLLFFAQKATAQYSIHIIAELPSEADQVYLAGSFNNWDPGDTNYLLKRIGMQRADILLRNLKAGNYQYKLTRGNPLTIECTAAGTNIKPRSIDLETDTVVHLAVASWSDKYYGMKNLSDSMLYEAMMARAGYYAEINLDSSYKYATQLYKLSQKLHLPVKEARALDLQANIFIEQGNGEKALELLYQSLSIKKSLQDSSGGTSFTYSSIGKVYEAMQDYSNARENYVHAAQWLNKTNEKYQAAPFTAIGNIFFHQHDIDSALYFARRVLELNNSYYGALLLMGDIELQMGNPDAALKNYRAASIASSKGIPGTPFYNNPGEAFTKIAAAFHYIGQKDSAYVYGRMAYGLARAVNNPVAIVNTADVLISLFVKDHHYDSAFLYQQLVIQKKDSLFTAEKEKQVHNIYFNEKLRQQELEARDEKYGSQMKIYMLAGLTILLVLLGLGYRARLRTGFYRQLAATEMRALRAQMNPHFIFNCLVSINRYIIKSDTKTASAYLTKFSKLIRLILDNSSSEWVTIDAEIQTLKLYLDMESLRFDHSFEYEIQSGTLTRTDNTAIPAMIIQPYIENAIWHGLLQMPDEAEGKPKHRKLWLRFAQINENMLQVIVEDNGIGRKRAAELRSKDAVHTKSYGMQISKDRIEIINAQHRIKSSVKIEDMQADSGNAAGTKVILYLPLIEMAAKPNAVNK